MHKHKRYGLFLLMGICFYSCNSDKNPNESSTSEILVQQSPWDFKSYELTGILDSGDSILTEQEITDDVINELTGVQISFYANGNGFSDFPGNDDSIFTWELLEDNQLQIDFSIASINDLDVYQNLMVSSTELRFSSENLTYDAEADFSVTHVGTLMFKSTSSEK